MCLEVGSVFLHGLYGDCAYCRIFSRLLSLSKPYCCVAVLVVVRHSLSETEEMEEWAPLFISSLKCDKCVKRVVESAFEAESLVLDEEQMVESETVAKSFLLGSQYVDLNPHCCPVYLQVISSVTGTLFRHLAVSVLQHVQ